MHLAREFDLGPGLRQRHKVTRETGAGAAIFRLNADTAAHQIDEANTDGHNDQN